MSCCIFIRDKLISSKRKKIVISLNFLFCTLDISKETNARIEGKAKLETYCREIQKNL